MRFAAATSVRGRRRYSAGGGPLDTAVRLHGGVSLARQAGQYRAGRHQHQPESDFVALGISYGFQPAAGLEIPTSVPTIGELTLGSFPWTPGYEGSA